jgi:hypothetical protein
MLVGGFVFVALLAAVCIPVANRAARAHAEATCAPVPDPRWPRRDLFSTTPRESRGVAPEIAWDDSTELSDGELAGTLMGVSDGPAGSVAFELLVSAASGRFAQVSTPALRSVLVDRSVLDDARVAGVEDLGEVVVSVRCVAVAGELFTERQVTVRPAH